MRILAVSDIHGDWGDFRPDHMPPADLALCAGDLTDGGVRGGDCALDLAAAWLRAMGRRYPRVLWVPGNHDVRVHPDTFGPAPNVQCVLDRTVVLDRPGGRGPISLHGVSLCPAYGHPDLVARYDYMTDDRDAEEAAFRFEPVDIVLSHGPPHGARDLWPGDERHPPAHIGSRPLADYVRRHGPPLVVCGHVHDDPGRARVGPTRVHNVARRWAIIAFP
jgi:Icc-related predicted phosphoesterase